MRESVVFQEILEEGRQEVSKKENWRLFIAYFLAGSVQWPQSCNSVCCDYRFPCWKI
jgi:hypothetical protein